MVFTGTYEHTIDAKNRLAIPSEIRSQIQRSVGVGETDAIVLYVMPGEAGTAGDGSLALYTEEAFERLADRLDDSQLDADALLVYEQLMYSMSRRVEIDKQGRVRLPDTMLKQSGLGSEVVLLGVKDHLEIRDREAWNAQVLQLLQQRPGLLMNPRRALRRSTSA